MSVAFAWALVAVFGTPTFNLGSSVVEAVNAPVTLTLLGRSMPIGV